MGKNSYGIISSLNIDLTQSNQLTYKGVKVGEIKNDKFGNISVRIDMNARKYYFNECMCDKFEQQIILELQSNSYFGNLEIKQSSKLNEYKVKFTYTCRSQYEIDSGVKKLKLIIDNPI